MAKRKTNNSIEDDDSNVLDSSVGHKSGTFTHFKKHFSMHAKQLQQAISIHSDTNIAVSLGALDCLYWQSLGFGHTRLASRISKFIRSTYQHHNIVMFSHK